MFINRNDMTEEDEKRAKELIRLFSDAMGELNKRRDMEKVCRAATDYVLGITNTFPKFRGERKEAMDRLKKILPEYKELMFILLRQSNNG